MTTRLIATTTARRTLAASVLVFLFGLGLIGCSDDDENKNPVGPGNPSSGTTHLTGTFTGANENGRVDLTVNTANLAHARGAAKATVIGSAVINVDAGPTFDLSGTYDPQTDSLFVTGGGFTLVGKLTNVFVPDIAGVYVGPNGTGNFEVIRGSQAEVGVYCGTYLDQDQVQQGRWNFLLFQNHVIGLHSPASGGFIRMTGEATGAGAAKTFTLTADPQFGPMTATGTVNTDDHHANGTWQTTGGAGSESGTWTAEFCENGAESDLEEHARMAP